MTERQLYPKAAMERAMKVQELILRAMAGRINAEGIKVDSHGLVCKSK